MRHRNADLAASVKRDLRFEFTESRLTSYAGLELFRSYLGRSRLNALLRSHLDPQLSRDFRAVALVRLIVALLIVGGPYSAKRSNTRQGFHLARHATIPRTMRTIILALFASLRAGLMTRATLALENAALRQQLAVYRRTHQRVRLRNEDRVFWVAVRRLWPDLCAVRLSGTKSLDDVQAPASSSRSP